MAGGATFLDSGAELIRAEGGLDLRIVPGVAAAPVLGVSADLLERTAENGGAASSVVCVFAYFGLQLRLDPFAGRSRQP